MKADSPHWKVMGPPASPEEAAALEAFREVLPDDGRHTAWVNLTFVDANGRTGEIDVLLLTPVGFFVAELKGWHGTITGDSQRWYQRGKTHENPFIVTDRKGKRLASLLKSYATPAQIRSVPFVQPLIVLHGQDSTFAVDESGRAGVIKLDGYTVQSKPPLAQLSEFLRTPPRDPRDNIDPQRAKLVERLCEKADFRPTPKTRMVGDFAVSDPDPIAEGVDWQDIVVAHPNVPAIKHRLRLYDVPPKSSKSERTRIEQLAQREFQLTYGTRHEGIAVAQQFLTTDDGPALVFAYDDAERPLDAYLADEGAALSLEDRVALVEQLGEVLRYAHQRHLNHRALSPDRVWVRKTPDGPRLEIRDWYSGQREHSSATSTRWTVISAGVTDLLDVAAARDLIWLAPEARHSLADVPGAPLDVFGFGALAFLILTGKSPATTITAVQQVQDEAGCFDPRRVSASIPDGLADVVAATTAVTESQRPASVEDALELFRLAWDDVRRPNEQATPDEVEDPLEAQTGDMIEGRFLVAGKRGEGSSGVALAVLDDTSSDDKELVLKVARNDAAGQRLDIEADVLKGLNHPRIVRLLDTLELGGRKALLMSDAGKETLATRLAKEGQSTLEQLQRWGTDLLDAMAYLVDTKGVFHRDIKPANLGIAPDPGTRKPHLTLFDFSLAREPLENTASGTPGYVDPYLGKGRRTRYDRPAELWAVAVTLFEMATGVLPWWPNGAGAPTTATERAVVEPTSFDPAVAGPTTEFFRKALAPDVKDRFGNVEDMLHAWTEIYAALELDVEAREHDDALAAAATLDTPLEQAGLSAQALSALRRLPGVLTVGDLLGVHPVKVNGIRGLGEKYRKEIQTRIGQWRHALSFTEVDAGPDANLGVERVVARLMESLPAADRPIAQDVLGLGYGGPWPTYAEVATSFQTTRERVTSLLDDAVGTWSKNRAFLAARDELVTLLARSGRIMTVPEAVAALVALRGSTLDGAARTANGTALVRAIVELDYRGGEPAFEYRRRVGAKADLLALTESATSGDAAHPAGSDLLTELAAELGAKADELVAPGAVVVGSIAVGALREMVTQLDTAHQWHVPEPRLLRLAAAASQNAAVSGFEELYPRSMPVKDALEYAMRGKPGRAISELAVRRTVTARFPHLDEALPVPGKLDALMRELFPDLVNRNGVYEPKSTVYLSTGTMSSTQFASTPVDEVTRRLTESLSRHSALTLAVPPKRYVAATRTLADTFDIDVVDVATLVVEAARDRITQAGGQWPGLLGYDALDRDSKQWKGLENVVQQSVEPVWDATLATERPLLLVNAGPLVRYGMSTLLATLLDTGTRRPAARWLLVAKTSDANAPMLEGKSVPMGPSGWIDLPRDLALLTDDAATPATPETRSIGDRA